MTGSVSAELVALANNLADAARPIAARYFRTPVAVDDKADQSPVTIADREAETAMRALLDKQVPLTASGQMTVKPYTALELTGRDLYVKEGCYLCHSQMIRPLRGETERYGHYSVAGESVYDHPFQWGSKRTGPDLAREGGKYPNLWHYQHLVDPRAITPGSNMPPYAHLEGDRFDRVVASNTGLPVGEGVNAFMQQWLDFSQAADELPIGALVRGGVTRTLSDGSVWSTVFTCRRDRPVSYSESHSGQIVWHRGATYRLTVQSFMVTPPTGP